MSSVQLGNGLVVQEVNLPAVESEIGLLGELFIFCQLSIMLLKCRKEIMGRQAGLAKENVKAPKIVKEQ